MAFKPGDKVTLKPGQAEQVQKVLSYGTVYTVKGVSPGYVRVDGDDWLAERFEPAPVAVPTKGDEVEIVLRARVSAIQELDGRTIIYFKEIDGQYVSPVYLGDGILSINIINPAKPMLDLDALPDGSVVEGLFEPPLDETSSLYRKNHGTWRSLDGRRFMAVDLYAKHTELIELVRKDGPA